MVKIDNIGIKLEDVSVSFPDGEDRNYVLDNICMSFNKGLNIITGRSGSGKTTLLNVICGRITPYKGCVYINGKKVYAGCHDAQMSSEMISFIEQQNNLIPELSVKENICLSSFIKNETIDAERLLYVADITGLNTKSLSKETFRLSGGERQRVAIARALYSKKKIIIADEPTGSLDYESGLEIMRLIRGTADKEGFLFILVTHEKDHLLFADRRFELRQRSLYEID